MKKTGKKNMGNCITDGSVVSYGNGYYTTTTQGVAGCSISVGTPLYVTNQKPMKKLNAMMKKLLDADTQKLVKAGFINGDLELTQQGKDALWSILFAANKAELVKLADEVIAEEKD